MQARPRLESARFQKFNIMKIKFAFNLNLVYDLVPLHQGFLNTLDALQSADPGGAAVLAPPRVESKTTRFQSSIVYQKDITVLST